MNLDEHVRQALYKAVVHKSALPENVLSMGGMSSPKMRHFLNNVCAFDECHYLEIGPWKGATLASAVYGHGQMKFWAVDNWSDWVGDDNPRSALFDNWTALFGLSPKDWLIEQDFRLVDLNAHQVSGVNVLFYGAARTEPSAFQALEHYLPVTADPFIYLVDNWNDLPVRQGTERALRELNIHAIYHAQLPAMQNGDSDLWWNGFGIYVLHRNSAPGA